MNQHAINAMAVYRVRGCSVWSYLYKFLTGEITLWLTYRDLILPGTIDNQYGHCILLVINWLDLLQLYAGSAPLACMAKIGNQLIQFFNRL